MAVVSSPPRRGTAARFPPAAPLSSLEIGYGLLLGSDPAAPPFFPSAAGTPRQTLEAILLDALRRPPCVISFSGGQDSSALLAVAVTVARREGLEDPIAASLEFPSSAAADESAWQRLVLERFGIREWVRLPFTDELDAVGPVAAGMLRRHGLVWPFNLHFHLPIIELAAGGSLVTGFGGDELGRTTASLLAERLVYARRLRGPRDAALIAYRLGPRPVKVARELLRGRGYVAASPWLRPRAKVRLARALASDQALPFGWGRLLAQWSRSRYLRVCRANFDAVAEPYDVRTVHPFSDPRLLESLAGSGRWAGFGARGSLLDYLAGDVVPVEILERTTKAAFSDPLWTPTARAFARRWSGDGLDARVIDPEAARRAMLADRPSAMLTPMLQAAWLADQDATAVRSSISP